MTLNGGDFMNLPETVSPTGWEAARESLLVKEKEATRALDALAAERRRLPMVRIEKQYLFEGANGKATLLDMFDGSRQLIVYHFMFAPGSEACTGCSSFTDNIGHLAHLRARERLSDIFHVRSRRGSAPNRFQSPGPHSTRPTGRVGGLPIGVATDSAVSLVAQARRVRRRDCRTRDRESWARQARMAWGVRVGYWRRISA